MKWKEELEKLEKELAYMFSMPNDDPHPDEVDEVTRKMYLLRSLIQAEENEP